MLIPLHDRVLILPDKAEVVSTGGIIIPDTAQEKPGRGKVVASGKGYKDLPNETKAGDIILYGKFAGTEIDYEGEKYLMIRETDVLAIDPV